MMPFLWHAFCHRCIGGAIPSKAVAALEKATSYVLFCESEENLEGDHPSLFRGEVDSRPPRAGVRRVAVRVDDIPIRRELTAEGGYSQHARMISCDEGPILASASNCVRARGESFLQAKSRAKSSDDVIAGFRTRSGIDVVLKDWLDCQPPLRLKGIVHFYGFFRPELCLARLGEGAVQYSADTAVNDAGRQRVMSP